MNSGQIIHSKIQSELSRAGNTVIALGQKKYMKSEIPYWGVQSPELKIICAKIFKDHPPINNSEYRNVIIYLFNNAEKREEWYVAMNYALNFNKYKIEKNIDVYMKIVCISQWWDVVDSVAQNLIGRTLLDSPNLHSYLHNWIINDNMWVRRTALLAQLKYKEKTEFELLVELILQVCNETEFFIRKAIGWALRQYSYTNPEAVENFIGKYKNRLSNLSKREGMKVIKRKLAENK